jgi:hypothetical protein
LRKKRTKYLYAVGIDLVSVWDEDVTYMETHILLGGNREHGGGGMLLPLFQRVGGAVPIFLHVPDDV